MGRFARVRSTAVRIAIAAVVTITTACGGDSTAPGTPAQPQPPAGSATKVPRVLGLSTINGQQLPAMHYYSPTYQSDAWTDSGSATLQDDSMLVLRTFTRWVAHGAGAQASGTLDAFTTAGRLRGDGIVIMPYSDGSADTAHVLANGAISAQLSIDENGVTKPYGTYLFAAPYVGGALNPIPYIRAITPDTAPEFADSVVVTLTGSSLLPTTRVTWDGVLPLTVTYMSPYQLTAVIPGAGLQVASVHKMTVSNPAPGGGDRVFLVPVTVPEPAIISIAPASVVTGGGDFTLYVHGRAFVAGKTQLLWNGAPRPTTVTSPTSLTAAIPNADIQTAGTYPVAVQTPAPGGGTSGVIYLTVSGSPAQKLAEVSAPFGAADLVVDPTRTLVYARPSPAEHTYPNSIAAIDPATGSIVWTLDLGAVPVAMAISDDGAYLYAVAGTRIVRVALATHTIALTIPAPLVGNSWISRLAVMPGQPGTIAVQYNCYCDANGVSNQIEIYDDAQQRAQTATLYGTPGPLAFTSAQSLHALVDNFASDLSVTSAGVAVASRNVAQVGSGVMPYIDGGRAFTASGVIYDLATHATTHVPNMPGGYNAALSSDGTMMYTTDDTSPFVRAYDVGTGAQVGAVQFTTSPSTPRLGSIMVRWGTDGLALTLMNDVVFLRATFVK